MDQERNMKFMQIGIGLLPEAKAMLDESGIEMNMESLQPMIQVLLKAMEEAYQLGRSEALEENK